MDEDLEGSLVKRLLESKEELEGQVTNDGPTSSSIPSESSIGRQDVEILRQSIQSLTTTANPLGRLLDSLYEDVDAMFTEIRMWEEEYENNCLQLKQQQNVTDSEAEESRSRLHELQSEISEKRDKIEVTKSLIDRQEAKLKTLTGMVVKKSPSSSSSTKQSSPNSIEKSTVSKSIVSKGTVSKGTTSKALPTTSKRKPVGRTLR